MRPGGKQHRVSKARGILVGLIVALVGLGISPGLDSGHGQEPPAGNEPTGTPNLALQSVTLNPSYVEDPQATQVVQIQATITNDGTADITAGGFVVEMTFRAEYETAYRPITLCVVCSFAFTEQAPFVVGETRTATGVLSVATLPAGRYLVRVTLKPQGIEQLSTADDERETLLLIGIVQPEYHPFAITFRPPSPVAKGTPVTVRVQIENTGKPESPEMVVLFEHCLESPTCIEYSSGGFQQGAKRLSRDETRPLAEGKVLEVTDVLDTSKLQAGRYLIRVRIQLLEGRELDETNNELIARLTVSGPGGTTGATNAICRLEGEVITLGQGVGTSPEDNRPVAIIYVGVKDSTGRVTLHAFRKNDVDQAEPGSICPEIENSPLPLGAEITAFALDQKVKLLYIGLANGQLVIVNLDSPELLEAQFKTVAASFPVESRALQALAPHLIRSRESEVFIGSRNGSLYRVRVNKGERGEILSTTTALCFQAGSPINTVAIFQGNKYLGTQDGTLYRMPEDACPRLDDERVTTLFTAGGAIQAVAFGRVSLTYIFVGLANGDLHMLTLGGADVTGSPFEVGEPITALTFDQSNQTVYVGTSQGTVYAVSAFASLFLRCVLKEPIQGPVHVLAVDDGGAGDLPGTGLLFIGSEDTRLYVMSESCELVTEPRRTEGPIRATIVLEGVIGIFGFEGISALYGGGNGLYKLTIPLSAIE